MHMQANQHQAAAEAFFPGLKIASLEPYGNGHINDTYLLEAEGGEPGYILQRINTAVFKNPQGIIANHIKLQHAFGTQQGNIVIPALIPLENGDCLYFGRDGGAWRAMEFIPQTHSIELVEAPWQARQAGNAFGWFAARCSLLDAAGFEEAIPDFHRLSFRLGQLREAVAENRAKRLEGVRKVVDFFLERAEPLGRIESMTDKGDIPVRVVHNDTKINNLLFRGDEAAAVIDLDTVGPGSLFYDYGDAIRTGANAAKEDERDRQKSALVPWAFEAYTLAYMKQVKTIATPLEIAHFHMAPVLMTYIMGIRFLADYLNGDTYYKTAYPDHNLVRTRVQQALIESMESRAPWMQDVIAKAFR